MKKCYIVILLFCQAVVCLAQDGTLKGKITDQDTNEELIGANIVTTIDGQVRGVATDVSGNYELKLPAGTHTIVVSSISYENKTIPNVTVQAGATASLNVKLTSSTRQIEEVVVQGKADRQTEAVLMIERRNASALIQNIGAIELNRVAASDAAEGLKRVVGLSVVGSKYVFVRGLGDRYNTGFLNGFPIASPDPDRRVIPFDIFPTNVIQNLSVVKAFSPELYGDFSGAAIQIKTRDFPDRRILSVGVGTSINTQTTFKDFTTNSTSEADVLGYNQERELPGSPANFSTSWNPVFRRAPLNKSFTFTYGDNIVTGAESSLGFYLNANFDDNYLYEFGNYRAFRADGSAQLDYDVDNYVYSTTKSALGNIAYRINNKNIITFNGLYTHLSTDGARETRGFFFDSQGDNDIFTRRFTYRYYSLLATQLSGEHTLSDKLVFSWGASRSTANSEEPDRRQLVFLYNDRNEASNIYPFNIIDRIENHRFFSDLNDQDLSGKVDFAYTLKANEADAKNPFAKLSVGAQYRQKDRDFSSRIFAYLLNNINVANPEGIDINNVDAYVNPSNYRPTNPGVGEYTIQEATQLSDTYSADLQVISGYANLDYSLIPNKLKVFVGARVESAVQGIDYRRQTDSPALPVRRQELNNTTLLPSLSLRYNFSESSIARLSASRTISRPDFKEVSEFQYREFFAGFANVGNPFLTNGYNNNVDVRYEKFLPQGGIFAVGAFGKILQDPIVRTIIGGSVLLQSYQNGERALLGGLELEYRRRLDFIGLPFINDLILGTNASLAYSDIEVGQGQGTTQTSNERPLEGASPYLINVDLTYEKNLPKFSTTWTLAYNVFGRRLYGIGASGLGDSYELPVNTLNLSIRNEINDRFSVSATAKNLLNPTIRIEQEIVNASGDAVREEELSQYKLGVSFSLGVSYRILR